MRKQRITIINNYKIFAEEFEKFVSQVDRSTDDDELKRLYIKALIKNDDSFIRETKRRTLTQIKDKLNLRTQDERAKELVVAANKVL